ncbi:hypothetical protein B566_EDAN011939 [Ephemera danica]|nr:hypothetical protein B566_EDAN011939 [Ephemera danica]
MSYRTKEMKAQEKNEEAAQEPTVAKIRAIVENIPKLTNHQRREMKKVLIENIGAFSSKPGRVKEFEYEINVKDDKPVKQATYPVPVALREQMDIEIEKMLQWGIIRKEQTQYINPIIPVKKKDGSIRPCLDARKINKIILPDYDRPMPPEEMLQRFHGCRYLSTMDLAQAFWQVPLSAKSRKYTGFLYKGESYVFNVVPFGLSTSVASLNRCLHDRLGPEILEYTTVYVDDLLIATPTFELHIQQLEKLLKKLIEIGMTIKLSKTLFCRDKVHFVGHILTPIGISVDQERLNGIRDFPRPQNKENLQQFLGTCTGRWRACIPYQMIKSLVITYHEEFGHYGAGKMINKISDHFVWPNMSREIRKIVAACDVCQKSKHPNRTMRGRMQCNIPERPGEIVAGDLYGPLPAGQFGMVYILVLVDVFTKFVVLLPLRHAKSLAILRNIRQYYIPIVRRPLTLLVDHATYFTSPVFVKGLENEGIQVRYSSVRCPSSNPAERVMRELGRIFRAYCHQKHTSWVRMLPQIACWMNITMHDSTGCTPFELQQGSSPREEISRLINAPPDEGEPCSTEDLRVLAHERMKKKAAARAEAADNSVEPQEYTVGDKVLVKSHHQSSAKNKEIAKFFLLYNGPYLIEKVIGPNAYLVRDEKNNRIVGTFNTRNLKKYNV